MPDRRTVYSTNWTKEPSAAWLTVPLDLFASFFLTAMVLLTVVDVIGREVFNSPVFAAAEITTLLMPLIVFMVLPYVTYQEEHITVDLIDLIYPKEWINARQIAITVILVPLLVGIAWQMLSLSFEWRDGPDLTEDLQFPKWYIAWFIAALTGISALLLLLNLGRYLKGRGPLSPGSDSAEPHEHRDGL